MAQATNTYDAYDASTSNREDLADIIYNISPVETPFMTSVGRGSASNKKHEWQIDSLAAAGSNRQLEGEQYAGDARTSPSRLYGYTQISAKALTVSGTQEVIDKAGRKSEIAYQLSLQGRELKRDMERHAVGFQTTADAGAIGGGAAEGDSYPNAIGDSSTAERSTASVRTWLRTNTDLGVGGVNAAVTGEQPNDAEWADPGTPRALLESQIKTVIRNAWVEGGNPGLILVDAFNKQVISSFTGGATRFDKSEDKHLYTSVDIYVSDFGDHRVVPDRFLEQPGAALGVSAYILDTNFWSVDYLRQFQQMPLAKTGDAENRLLLCEWTICSKNEKASGCVADLTYS